MSALAAECGRHAFGWAELVRTWEETDWPESWKVEIIEGIITMAPPPSTSHNVTAELVQRELYGVIPKSLGIYQTLGVSIPRAQGLYIPDLVVVPKDVLKEFRYCVPADEALLVVEITSKSNGNQDRLKKVSGYAQAGVPLYLLLDPWHSGRPSAILYGMPEDGAYRVLQSVEYGEEIRLPEPFDLTLDTSEFPAV